MIIDLGMQSFDFNCQYFPIGSLFTFETVTGAKIRMSVTEEKLLEIYKKIEKIIPKELKNKY